VLSQGNRRGIHQFQSGKLAFNVWIADNPPSDLILKCELAAGREGYHRVFALS